MIQLRDIFRLRFAAERSLRQIESTLKLCEGVVHKYVPRFGVEPGMAVD